MIVLVMPAEALDWLVLRELPLSSGRVHGLEGIILLQDAKGCRRVPEDTLSVLEKKNINLLSCAIGSNPDQSRIELHDTVAEVIEGSGAKTLELRLLVEGFPSGVFEIIPQVLRQMETESGLQCQYSLWSRDAATRDFGHVAAHDPMHQDPDSTLSLDIPPFDISLLDYEERSSVHAALNSLASVLITGPVGSGKTSLARYIHEHCPATAQHGFVSTNVSELSAELAMSELKGHVRGAFTGAIRDKAGLLVLANGGTVFLDEIAEADARVQTMLLDLVRPRMCKVGFSRVGEDRKTNEASYRVVGATNIPIELWSERGFRPDLRSRLPLQIRLKSLHEKRGDKVFYFMRALEGFTRWHYVDAPEQVPYWPRSVVTKAVAAGLLPGEMRSLGTLVDLIMEVRRGKKGRSDAGSVELAEIETASGFVTGESKKTEDSGRRRPARTLEELMGLACAFADMDGELQSILRASPEDQVRQIIFALNRASFEVAATAGGTNIARATRLSHIKSQTKFRRILADPERRELHPAAKRRKG